MNTEEKMTIGELKINNGQVKFVSGETGAMTAKSPETDAEAGFLTIVIGGVTYEIPIYAIA